MKSKQGSTARAWLLEIVRRAREVEAGEAELEEWSTVRRRALARWRRAHRRLCREK